MRLSQRVIIRGLVVSTKVSIGDISVPDMPVGVATELGIEYPLAGFMGLGFGAQITGLLHLRPLCHPCIGDSP